MFPGTARKSHVLHGHAGYIHSLPQGLVCKRWSGHPHLPLPRSTLPDDVLESHDLRKGRRIRLLVHERLIGF